MTVSKFRESKGCGSPLVCVTAYDAPFAQVAERAGVDAILVGDSVGRAVLGYTNEFPVTVSDIVHHTAAVTRAVNNTLVVADLPYQSYATPDDALRNAATLLQTGGAAAVKIEGGLATANITRELVNRGMPVMAHVGLTPQSAHVLGGYRVQGKGLAEAQEIVNGAQAQANAGAFAIVLEMLPAKLAGAITKHVPIPTIGIGAGVHCDGQIQVLHDLLGLSSSGFRHSHVFAEIASISEAALREYAQQVRSANFPSLEQSFKGKRGTVKRLTFE